ncbi:MAG: hypothetical protein J4224_02205 [Candidatus Diapherotrites archaeon]|uniref:Uncharacterized protein n=1 Tax=Candidatus Iainarchaeum sp. TaxID=3101447 RepID=A0A7J4ITN1_9ARCH|nr:MAG: hypothetical protein QT03_C0001G0515 [archaeon GW2011_AR10]MBS3059217.1 hypothetical protein [Candidatus Diapherotrites archaeon]HIH08861.1 hypothetical protein [Candidatus Diapherotrites archaeon]
MLQTKYSGLVHKFLVELLLKEKSRLSAEELEVRGFWDRLLELKYGVSNIEFKSRKLTPAQVVVVSTVDFAEGIKTVEKLKQRLRAETQFYENLYAVPLLGKFRISLKQSHQWPDKSVTKYVNVFECPPGIPIGYTRFESNSRNIGMLLFQGEKGADVRKANEILGKPWFEVFMDRIIESYRPLHKAGVSLHQYLESGREVLPAKVRDRYFARKFRGEKPYILPLSIGRQRVKRLLRLR